MSVDIQNIDILERMARLEAANEKILKMCENNRITEDVVAQLKSVPIVSQETIGNIERLVENAGQQSCLAKDIEALNVKINILGDKVQEFAAGVIAMERARQTPIKEDDEVAFATMLSKQGEMAAVLQANNRLNREVRMLAQDYERQQNQRMQDFYQAKERETELKHESVLIDFKKNWRWYVTVVVLMLLQTILGSVDLTDLIPRSFGDLGIFSMLIPVMFVVNVLVLIIMAIKLASVKNNTPLKEK